MDSRTTSLLKRLLASGLSQTEISRRTGIPQPRLSRWASGDTPASADDVLRLAELESAIGGDSAAGATGGEPAAEDKRAGEDRRKVLRPIAFGDRRSGADRRDGAHA